MSVNEYTPPTDRRTPALRPGDVCVGCIVWLPPKGSQESPVLCNKHGCGCIGAALNDEGYNHPVVVLRIRQRANSRNPGDLVCTVACVTSFGDAPLSAYKERQPQMPSYQQSIPILDPTSPTSQDDSRNLSYLVLEKGILRKQSYVRLDHTYEVPVDMLTQYRRVECRAYELRLSKESYRLLSEKFKIPPETFEETSILSETEARRLLALADPSWLAQNTTPPRPRIENFPRFVLPPVSQPPLYQSNASSARQRTSLPPITRYGSTSFTQSRERIQQPCSDNLPYSNFPEPSDADSSSSVLKWIIGAAIVGSIAWWRYSVSSRKRGVL